MELCFTRLPRYHRAGPSTSLDKSAVRGYSISENMITHVRFDVKDEFGCFFYLGETGRRAWPAFPKQYYNLSMGGLIVFYGKGVKITSDHCIRENGLGFLQHIFLPVAARDMR